jgi:hypothetical protein
MGVQVSVNSGNRLIRLHIGGINGFLPNAALIYKAGSATGDCRGQMNAANFEKWAVEKLIPILPAQSVTVLDNAPYHCLQTDKLPSAYAIKADTISWIRKKGVNCNEKMRKNELYNLILPLKPKEKIYKIDHILKTYGHAVVRQPPYMCDLNPIELAWAKIERIVRENIVTGDLSLQKLQVTKDTVALVTKEDWEGFFRHTQTIES